MGANFLVLLTIALGSSLAKDVDHKKLVQMTKHYFPTRVLDSQEAFRKNCGRELVTTSKPWEASGSPRCRHYTVQPSPPGTWDPLPFVTYPGSGTRFLHRLATVATGRPAGSVYFNIKGCKDEPYQLTYSLPWDGTTIYQITHWTSTCIFRREGSNCDRLVKFAQEVFKSSRAGILLIRDPWKALLAFYQHRTAGVCTRVDDDPKQFLRKSYRTGMEESARLWVELIESRLSAVRNGSDIIIIKFEELMKNPRAEMIRLIDYLGLEMDETRLDCALGKESPPDTKYKRSPLPKALLNVAWREMRGNTKVDSILMEGMANLNKIFKEKNIDLKLTYEPPQYV